MPSASSPRLRCSPSAREGLGRWDVSTGAAASSKVGDGPEEFLRGLELHSGAAMPFERARTQLLYGVWL